MQKINQGERFTLFQAGVDKASKSQIRKTVVFISRRDTYVVEDHFQSLLIFGLLASLDKLIVVEISKVLISDLYSHSRNADHLFQTLSQGHIIIIQVHLS